LKEICFSDETVTLHDPPRPPLVLASKNDDFGVFFLDGLLKKLLSSELEVDGAIYLKGLKWSKWNGQDKEALHVFKLPHQRKNLALTELQQYPNASSIDTVAQSFHDHRSSAAVSLASGTSSINRRESSASESGLEELLDEDGESEESMPLLYVRQHKRRSFLKRMIDTLMSWEKRGAVEAHNKVARKQKRESAEEEEALDDEQDLDCFGRQDERHEFDWVHFGNLHFIHRANLKFLKIGFTLIRGLFLVVFSLFYLFSSRFSTRAKVGLLLVGMLNVGVVAMPIIAYQWQPAVESNLASEVALVWAPLVFYVLLVFVHSTVEGNWRDSGGSAASLNYLDSYESSVYVRQTNSHKNKRSARAMRGRKEETCVFFVVFSPFFCSKANWCLV
jgi:hypothetical protein